MRGWKDSNEEWQSKAECHRVVVFNRLGESIADSLHKGDHVLVDGQLVSSKYERENGKYKKAKAAKFARARKFRPAAEPGGSGSTCSRQRQSLRPTTLRSEID